MTNDQFQVFIRTLRELAEALPKDEYIKALERIEKPLNKKTAPDAPETIQTN